MPSSFSQRFARGLGLFAGGIAVGRVLRVDQQVGAYRRAWDNHNAATLRWLQEDGVGDRDPDSPYVLSPGLAAPFIMVSLGDSAAQGVGASSVVEGYVPRLAAAIEHSLGRPVALLNFSSSGATTTSVIVDQIPQLRGHGLLGTATSPDLITFNIGGNDVNNSAIDTDRFRHSLEQIFWNLPAGVLVGNLSSFGVLPAEKQAGEFSAIIDQLAARHRHEVVNLRGRSLELSTMDYLVNYHAADFFHPNSRAYADWSQLFFDKWATRRDIQPRPTSPPSWKMLSFPAAYDENFPTETDIIL